MKEFYNRKQYGLEHLQLMTDNAGSVGIAVLPRMKGDLIWQHY
jgi:hypothetical protein